MGRQPSFFDLEERYAELSKAGDPLEKLFAVFDARLKDSGYLAMSGQTSTYPGGSRAPAQRRREAGHPREPHKPRGVPRVDDRRVLNGILWRFRTGSPWAEIPGRYGPHTTCYNRFVRWRKAGVWDHILQEISKACEPVG